MLATVDLELPSAASEDTSFSFTKRAVLQFENLFMVLQVPKIEQNLMVNRMNRVIHCKLAKGMHYVPDPSGDQSRFRRPLCQILVDGASAL